MKCYPVLLIIRTPAHNAPQNTLYLSVDIFSTKVLIGDIIFTSSTGDNTTFYWWSSDPRESLAACRAKGLPSFLSYSKTQSIDPAPGIEPATSRYAVKRSSCCGLSSVTIHFFFRKRSLPFLILYNKLQ